MSRSLTITVTYDVPASVLFNTFLDSRDAMKFTRSPAEVSREVGGKFKFFNGNIEGENVEIVNNEKLVQKWRQSAWADYSTVTLEFRPFGDERCQVILKQTGIPEEDKFGNGGQLEKTLFGWKTYFFTGIKEMLGFHIIEMSESTD
eukprot:GILI01007619.1.p3 GENE.GILI01007619.1~~GILI01007619.1.p3  ORF type:complete len:146 (-),score=43.99 GILI01007619.1:878-1315(-)